LLASGRAVFVARGYHNTRVDDLVAAAGVSHGAFYRYFRNKDQLARMLTARAVQSVGAAVVEIPDVVARPQPSGKGALRRWLCRYHAAHVNEAAMLRVWVDAALEDPSLRAESAPLLDWGRRRMARSLRPREFGDVDIDAVVLVALLGVFGARPRPAPEIDAAAQVIGRGLLGR
jgi:AcrR family transcriptional regulator